MAMSERKRWVQVFIVPKPAPNADGGVAAERRHEEARAVIDAFHAVGRVVRVEPAKFGNGLVFEARRA